MHLEKIRLLKIGKNLQLRVPKTVVCHFDWLEPEVATILHDNYSDTEFYVTFTKLKRNNIYTQDFTSLSYQGYDGSITASATSFADIVNVIKFRPCNELKISQEEKEKMIGNIIIHNYTAPLTQDEIFNIQRKAAGNKQSTPLESYQDRCVDWIKSAQLTRQAILDGKTQVAIADGSIVSIRVSFSELETILAEQKKICEQTKKDLKIP